MFVQTNVLDSDDDEDIVDNPSVVDSKVGNVPVISPLFFVNFSYSYFYYAFLTSLSLQRYVFILFLVAYRYSALLDPRGLFTPLKHFKKSLEVIRGSVNFP